MKHMAYTRRSRLAKLEDRRAALKSQLTRCEGLIKKVRTLEVADGVAAWVEAAPQFSAPSKAWWLENHSVAMWNKVKKPRNMSPIFAYLVS